MRTVGFFGEVSASYRVTTTDNTLDVSEQLSVAAGRVTLRDSESQADITIDVLQDPFSELEQQFEVELFAPQGGATLSVNSISTITVPASDDPHGVILLFEPQVVIEDEDLNM